MNGPGGYVVRQARRFAAYCAFHDERCVHRMGQS